MEKQRRKKLAALPFPEKITILEKLRRVSETAAKSGLRKGTAQLSEGEGLRVQALLDKPPAPNPKLLAAARVLPKRP
jgi:uncharacterized protein (DUF1778 family)